MLILCFRQFLAFDLDPKAEIIAGFLLLTALWETVRGIIRDRNWKDYSSQLLSAGLLVEEWIVLGIAWTASATRYLWAELPALQAFLGMLVVAALVLLAFAPSRTPVNGWAVSYAADRESYLRARLKTAESRRKSGSRRVAGGKRIDGS